MMSYDFYYNSMQQRIYLFRSPHTNKWIQVNMNKHCRVCSHGDPLKPLKAFTEDHQNIIMYRHCDAFFKANLKARYFAGGYTCITGSLTVCMFLSCI